MFNLSAITRTYRPVLLALVATAGVSIAISTAMPAPALAGGMSANASAHVLPRQAAKPTARHRNLAPGTCGRVTGYGEGFTRDDARLKALTDVRRKAPAPSYQLMNRSVRCRTIVDIGANAIACYVFGYACRR